MIIKLIFGAGGLGRETIQIAKRDDPEAAWYFIEDVPRAPYINNVPCVSTESFLKDYRHCAVTIAVGDPETRAKIERSLGEQANYQSIISKRATILNGTEIAPGAIVLDGARISTDAVLGKHFIANFNAVVGHDVIAGDYVTVSPGAHINGWTRLGHWAYIGTNAALINGSKERRLSIGYKAVIGMGAVILKDVPHDTTVVGVWKGPRMLSVNEARVDNGLVIRTGDNMAIREPLPAFQPPEMLAREYTGWPSMGDESDGSDCPRICCCPIDNINPRCPEHGMQS